MRHEHDPEPVKTTGNVYQCTNGLTTCTILQSDSLKPGANTSLSRKLIPVSLHTRPSIPFANCRSPVHYSERPALEQVNIPERSLRQRPTPKCARLSEHVRMVLRHALGCILQFVFPPKDTAAPALRVWFRVPEVAHKVTRGDDVTQTPR